MGPRKPPFPQKKTEGAILEQMTMISIINNAVWITAGSRHVLIFGRGQFGSTHKHGAGVEPCRSFQAPGGPKWPLKRTLQAFHQRECLVAYVQSGCRVTSLLNVL